MMRPGTTTLLVVPLLMLQACGGPRPLEPSASPPLTPSPATNSASRAARTVGELAKRAVAKPPILFIGLDGADWQQLEPLLVAGALPNLARLRSGAAWGELETEVPTLSPLLWTSMVTGVSPVDHGILDFARFSAPTGVREPIGSDERRAPAIWNDLTWAGKHADILGLWATHPAEPVDGVMVSDRLFGFLNVESAVPAGAVFPPERADWAISRLRAAEAATDLVALRSFLPWLTAADWSAHSEAARAYDHPISALRRILIQTRLFGGMAESLLGDAPTTPDLTLLYLEGTDSIGHVFAPFAPPRQATISATDFERYAKVPELYFREIDGLLGRLLALAERSHSTVVVASDHGFFWGEGRPDRFASNATQTAARWHRKFGIWLVRAAGVTPGRTENGRLRQVYPTLLALAGLPAAAGAETRPLAAIPPLAVPPFDYGRVFRQLRKQSPAEPSRPATAAASASAAQAAQEQIAQLRALGYIGAGEATRATPAALAAGSTRTASSFNNEGIVLRGEGRDREARAAFERAVELEPGLASAQWNLSEALFHADELDRSDEALARAFASGLPDGAKLVVGRAASYESGGKLARSIALLDRAIAAKADEGEPWLYRGRYRVQGGDCANALADLARAATLLPASSDVFATAALAHLCAGDRGSAIVALRRAIDLAPGEPRLRDLLAELQHAP
ncbi:MAG: alkaline phosphatase family protein [Thermoanaerobaculia bacterium]